MIIVGFQVILRSPVDVCLKVLAIGFIGFDIQYTHPHSVGDTWRRDHDAKDIYFSYYPPIDSRLLHYFVSYQSHHISPGIPIMLKLLPHTVFTLCCSANSYIYKPPPNNPTCLVTLTPSLSSITYTIISVYLEGQFTYKALTTACNSIPLPTMP